VVLQFQGVSKIFGKKHAVRNLSLSLKKGEVFGFLGPNGAGKTTTMKMILGLLRPTKGTITLLGQSPDSLAAKAKVGFLPEMAHLYPHLTGKEFLLFIGEIFGLSEKEREKRSRTLLKMVCLPQEAWDRHIRTYSKGMQQRLGMAQALVNDPEILFLDEPMSGLDPIGRHEMKEIILSLKKEGKTIFFNSHILADAESLCDRIGIIHQGQLLLEGAIADICSPEKNLETIFLETILGKEKKGKMMKVKITKVKAKPKAKSASPTTKKTPAKKTAPAKKPSTKKTPASKKKP